MNINPLVFALNIVLAALAGGGILYILEWQDVLYRATMQ